MNQQFKSYCMEVWGPKQSLYKSVQTYLDNFSSWKNMYIYRPKIRYEGIYLTKVSYYKRGQSETGWYDPLHKVEFYLLIKFNKDGSLIYGQTPYKPLKHFEKIVKGKEKTFHGLWTIKNNLITIQVKVGMSLYEYDYLLMGKEGT